MALKHARGKKTPKQGHTKDLRPKQGAIHPIEEGYNNSDALAEAQLIKSSKKRVLGRFDPKDNAQYR